jgi:hypothetical protein
LHADLCIDGTEAVDAGSLEVNLVKHRSGEGPSIVDTDQAARTVYLRDNANQVRGSLAAEPRISWVGQGL